MYSNAARFLILICWIPIFCKCTKNQDGIKVFTVATEENDGYKRFIQTAKNYDIEITTLGQGTLWLGGNMLGPGGGQKINLLRKALEPFKNKKNTIVLFTDSYDVVFSSGMDEIIKKFKASGARVLFGAEHFCWPNIKLQDMYPIVTANAARFLNSGMFIGYAAEIFEMIKSEDIPDASDDQLFYTKLFLDNKSREKYGIMLDSKSELFQNLNGAEHDVKLNVNRETSEGILQNIHFQTTPNIIHGNGPSKITLNSIANYIGTFKNNECIVCDARKDISIESSLPTVTLALFVIKPVPFFEEYLDKILSLKYPKSKISIFIYSGTHFHDKLLQRFVNEFGKEYKTIKSILSNDEIQERNARKIAVQQAQQKNSDYLFVVDNEVQIDNPDTLIELISFNKSFIAPMISKRNDLWSNFWGALSETNYYARSHDYVDIVKGNLIGIWNVPFVSSCYLVTKNVLNSMSFDNTDYDPDMALCESLRNRGIFMNIVNLKYYGHLINADDYNIDLARPDFYTLLSNPLLWEKRYIHRKYEEQLLTGYNHTQPCPDVYWFPIATEQFCDDLVAIMEHYGKWSGGSNKDDRLEGGYEAVPTRDIHMNQVGLDAIWLRFLKDYVRPLQEAVFTGYYHNPPKSLMNFVVRYRPDEQPFLRPHHDASTFTINIALNHAGADYIGGGCKFIRYNCSVTDTKKGYMLMHPGRLTHFHEGLRVTNGTRYIMISFIDP